MSKQFVVFAKYSNYFRRKGYKIIGGTSVFHERSTKHKRIKLRIWYNVACDREFYLHKRFKPLVYDKLVNTIFNWKFRKSWHDEANDWYEL